MVFSYTAEIPNTLGRLVGYTDRNRLNPSPTARIRSIYTPTYIRSQPTEPHIPIESSTCASERPDSIIPPFILSVPKLYGSVPFLPYSSSALPDRPFSKRTSASAPEQAHPIIPLLLSGPRPTLPPCLSENPSASAAEPTKKPSRPSVPHRTPRIVPSPSLPDPEPKTEQPDLM